MFDQQGSRKYLNHKEREAFFEAIKCESNKSRRAFCLTLFYTGCRISEALNLRVRCIDFSEKTVVFETLKRRKRRIFRAVPIPESLLALFGDFVHGIKQSKKVWRFSRPTGYRLVKDAMKKAHISGGMASPKGLRHGFGIACVTEKILLPTIQQWMGHARPETTAIYLGASGDEERALAARLWKFGQE